METSSKNFQIASDLNFELLKKIFGKTEKFKLLKPQRVNSVYDGILTTKKDNKDIAIFVEVKIRNFSTQTLLNDFNKTFFLEKDKYTYLHKSIVEFAKAPGRSCLIWYLCMTTDGDVFIFDLTNKDFCWVSNRMNYITYADNKQKVDKKVALLHIDSAISRFKIKK